MYVVKRLLSFLFPFTTKYLSKYSGNVEVTLYNGRKVLDTANANYSYGLLQKVLRKSLLKVDFC